LRRRQSTSQSEQRRRAAQRQQALPPNHALETEAAIRAHELERAPLQSNNNNSIADDVLRGAKAIGTYAGLPERDTFHKLERGYLPARKEGGTWVSSKSALRRHYFITANGEKPERLLPPIEPTTTIPRRAIQRRSRRALAQGFES
jgi:hypothetical protein